MAKVPEVAHILSFYPKGRNRAYVQYMGRSFRDTGRFSELPYLGMKLGNWQKIQKLYIDAFSTRGGWNWAYFCSTGSGVRDTVQFSKIAIFGHETWQLAKVPEVAHIPVLSFYPRGVEIEVIFNIRAAVSRYRPFFKISIFGHETCHMAKVSEVAHILFLPQVGRNRAYFQSTGSSFRDIGQFSKLPYLGMKLSNWQKIQKLHIYPFTTPKGLKLSLFLLCRLRFPRYRPIFKIPIFGHETCHMSNVSEVAHILLLPKKCLPTFSTLNTIRLEKRTGMRNTPKFDPPYPVVVCAHDIYHSIS